MLSKLTGEHSMGDWMQKAYCVLSFMEAHRCARDELPRFFHDDDAKAQAVMPHRSPKVQETVAEESRVECQKAEEVLKALPSDIVVLARTKNDLERLSSTYSVYTYLDSIYRNCSRFYLYTYLDSLLQGLRCLHASSCKSNYMKWRN